MDPERLRELARLLAATARAHHQATGGPNPGWARWYAEHLEGKVEPVLGFSPGVAALEEWLTHADEAHRAEAPEERWPAYYAEWILGHIQAT